MRIGIYPGSFNPVHKGHIAIARYLIRHHYVDQLLIVATGNYWNKQDLLPISDRIKMLEYFHSEKIIIEKEYNELPYTYQLMSHLQNRYINDDLALILGADSLIHFDQWKNYQELLKYDFILIPREGININKQMESLQKDNYQILTGFKEIPISSTYIRSHMNDYQLLKDQIDIRVYRYYKKLMSNQASVTE